MFGKFCSFFKNRLPSLDNVKESRLAKKISSIPSLGKEIILDVGLVTPYVIIDTILYYLTAKQFVHFLAESYDKEDKEVAYDGILIALMIILSLSYYCTFSKTNSTLVNLQNNNRYTKGKEKTRKISGIPAAFIKTATGASATYMVNKELIPEPAAISLSVLAFAGALPAMIALLWSEHTKNSYAPIEGENRLSKKILTYAVIHFLTFLYSLDNTSIYLWSTLNLPKRLGIIDHDLINYENGVEQFLFYFSFFIAAFPLYAMHISYSHLNENMFGLVATESPSWANFKRKTKRITGPIAATVKVFNAGVSAFNFFEPTMPRAINIILSAYGSIAGLVTQASILAADPIKKQESFTLEHESNKNSVLNLSVDTEKEENKEETKSLLV